MSQESIPIFLVKENTFPCYWQTTSHSTCPNSTGRAATANGRKCNGLPPPSSRHYVFLKEACLQEL